MAPKRAATQKRWRRFFLWVLYGAVFLLWSFFIPKLIPSIYQQAYFGEPPFVFLGSKWAITGTLLALTLSSGLTFLITRPSIIFFFPIYHW